MVFVKHKDKSKKNKPRQPTPEPEGPIRVRLPKGREILGIIDQRLGAGRISVRGLDGKERNCRVPGRLRRRLWLREGDAVIIEPWEFDETKGDVLFKYNPTQLAWLKKKGYLKEIEEEF